MMTRKEFGEKLVYFFGEYPDGQKPAMRDWTMEQSGDALEVIYKEIIRTFIPTSTVPRPLIAHLEEAKANVIDLIVGRRSAKIALERMKLQIEEPDATPEQMDELIGMMDTMVKMKSFKKDQ
jgi:hypothetical protein